MNVVEVEPVQESLRRNRSRYGRYGADGWHKRMAMYDTQEGRLILAKQNAFAEKRRRKQARTRGLIADLMKISSTYPFCGVEVVMPLKGGQRQAVLTSDGVLCCSLCKSRL